jgi:hypothetical protein
MLERPRYFFVYVDASNRKDYLAMENGDTTAARGWTVSLAMEFGETSRLTGLLCNLQTVRIDCLPFATEWSSHPFSSGSYVDAEGKNTHLTKNEFTITAADEWSARIRNKIPCKVEDTSCSWPGRDSTQYRQTRS